MKNIAIVTARSGSKGLAHKNIRKLGGVPLLGWVIHALLNSKLVDKIILSTDSDEYFQIAKKISKEILWHKRSAELAEDVPSELVLLDALREFKNLFDDDAFVILVQPTTPFILSTDIDKCIEMLNNSDANTCISVKKVTEHPEWLITKIQDQLGSCQNLAGDISVRQNLPDRWIANGGAYVVRRKFLEEQHKVIDESRTLVYEMPKIRSMDIDDLDDFKICESLVKSGIVKLEKHKKFSYF